MKIFRKFILSTNRNNLRLFVSLSIIALFAVTSLLLWQTAAQMQTAEQFSINGVAVPTLGNYPNTTVTVGANTTIAPDAVPIGATSINVSTNTNFKGTFAANPTTGVIRVTNAYPAGTYLVTVKAFDGSGGMTTKTFTLTVGNGTVCNGTTRFDNAFDVSVDFRPSSVAIGDFNNDGNQDLLTPNRNSNTVSVRLGDGAGNFSGTTNINVSQDPRKIAVGDFNNDGNQDFASAGSLNSQVSIRLGDGNGNFSGITDISVGINPIDIVTADFNNDGNLDLATANLNARTVSIRLGDGNGNFNAAPQVAFSVFVTSVAVGDFNNDGNKDLAIANNAANTVSIRLGDGNGNFSGNTSVSIADAPTRVFVGDFNNDGNQDLVTANSASFVTGVSLVTLSFGNGNGSFSGNTNVFFRSNAQVLAVGIGDFNNDGNQDLAIPIVNFGIAAIRLGDGLGNFTSIPDVGVGSSPSDIAIGDFNNDGKQDLAINNEDAGQVSIRLNRCVGPPTPTPTPPPVPTLGNYPNTTVTIGSNTTITPDAVPTNTTRINVSTNSNFKGLLAANPTTGIIRVTNAYPAGTYLVTVKAFNASGMTTKTFTLTVGNGPTCNGTVQFTNAADLNIGRNLGSVAVGDFNNDGIQDIAIPSFNVSIEGQFSNNIVAIRFGNGIGGFSSATNISVGTGPQGIAIGDFNNDGNQDFATANIFNSVSIRLGNGLGSFGTLTNVSVGSQPNSIAVGDFNNDGNQDFATANGPSNTISIRLGDGLGGFSSSADINSGITNPTSIVIGNFNNDGNQDLAIANPGSNTISIRLGNGLGGFSGLNNVSVGNNPISVAVGDFNNDGNQDFATANNGSNTVSIRLGDGLGGFNGSTEVSVGTQPISIKIGDFNNDGKQDVATTNNGSNTVSIRLGNGLGNFSGSTEVSVGNNPREIAIGDFNNDGTQDFATANTGNSTASIRLGGCLVTPTPTPTATPTPTPTPIASPTPTPTPGGNVCTPSTTVTEGDLFPGGIVSFGVSSGPGSVTVDHVNAGTGLQSLTLVGVPMNATVNIPAFTPGTTAPVVVTFTTPSPGLAVDFTLRAASTFHAAFIRVRCAETCTPSTTVTEGDLFPGGIVSFGVTSGPGSVTVDHVNAGTGLQSLTVVGMPVNAVVTIPPFVPGTTAPVVVTFTTPNPGLAVDFTLRAASTFHAAFIRVRCATPPHGKPEN